MSNTNQEAPHHTFVCSPLLLLSIQIFKMLCCQMPEVYSNALMLNMKPYFNTHPQQKLK